MGWQAKGWRWAAALCAAALISGCGDGRAANNHNLEKALNHDYGQLADCLFPAPLHFPYEVDMSDPLFNGTRHELDALTQAGLLNRQQSGQGKNAVERYTLTAEGGRVVGNGRFCYGKRHVTSVETFTMLPKYQGMPVTRVEYRYVIKNSPGWIKADDIRNAFPSVAVATSARPMDEAVMMLTSNGWELTY